MKVQYMKHLFRSVKGNLFNRATCLGIGGLPLPTEARLWWVATRFTGCNGSHFPCLFVSRELCRIPIGIGVVILASFRNRLKSSLHSEENGLP